MKQQSSNSNAIRNSLAAALLTAALPAQAAAVHWTNVNNGNWNLASNWDPHQVPSASDIAVVTNAGTYAVTLNANPTIAGLILGGDNGTQTLVTAGRTLTLNGEGAVNSNGRLVLSGGALSGANQITLAGAMRWESGAIDTNSTLMVGAGASVTLVSAGNHAKLLYGHLTNRGVITWQMYGNWGIGGTLHNLAGGVIDAQVENRSLTSQGDQAMIVNEGVFRKSAGAGDLPCAVPLHNSGTVDTAIGTLTLLGGSVLESGSTFVGAGRTWLGSGTHTIRGYLEAANLGLNGGTIAGTGRLSGLLTWAAGTIASGAAMTVAADSHLLLESAGNESKSLYGNLTNAGTVTFSTYGNLTLGGTFHNLAGGLFDVQTADRTIAAADTAAVIINDGVFRRSSSSGTVWCGVPILNHGTVEVLTGTLVIAGAFANSAGTISLAGGTLDMTQPLSLAGGLLTGWGTVRADVTNGGCIRPSRSNGVLTINGKFDQRLGGRLEFDLAGNSPGASQSRLNISGAATLRGTVGVIWDEGYVPSPDTLFPVLAFASRTGEFCCFDHFTRIGQGRQLTPVYNAGTLTLATVAAPEPSTVPLRVTVDESVLICWPAEFPGYELQWSTDLGQADWTALPEATNHFLESPPLTREKFFRLRKP